jgi:hydroxyacid-oxoacid transhydrogenase
LLAGAIVSMLRVAGMPNGLAAVGYGPGDVEQLVAGTLPQHRVTRLSPRPFTPEELARLFMESMTLW